MSVSPSASLLPISYYPPSSARKTSVSHPVPFDDLPFSPLSRSRTLPASLSLQSRKLFVSLHLVASAHKTTVSLSPMPSFPPPKLVVRAPTTGERGGLAGRGRFSQTSTTFLKAEDVEGCSFEVSSVLFLRETMASQLGGLYERRASVFSAVLGRRGLVSMIYGIEIFAMASSSPRY